MIHIAPDSMFVNRLANHPSVHPTAFPGREGMTEDLTAFVADEDNLVLEVWPYGAFVVHKNDFDTYVVHTMFLPKTTTKMVRESVAESLRLMFIELDATALYSSACSSNRAAFRLLRHTGFQTEFVSPSKHAKGHIETFGCITLNDYALNSTECLMEGREFHELAEGTVNHGRDDAHDCYVGLTSLMIKAGNVVKAQRVYNKWAAITGYAPMQIKDNIIEVGGMIIKLDDEMRSIEEIVCQ